MITFDNLLFLDHPHIKGAIMTQIKGSEKKGDMDIKWDWTLRGINSAKIISKTASGKSCNIEIQAYDYDPVLYEKVRMSNVDALLWQYRDYVINA